MLRENERKSLSTDLRTDSTNTLNAFKWIQATNTELKFTFSQRTKIACRGSIHVLYTTIDTQTQRPLHWCWTHILLLLVNTLLLYLLLLLRLHIIAVLAHGEPVWIIGYTMVMDTDNTALTWLGIFWQSVVLTCSPGLWFWSHTRLFWKV